MSAPLKQGLDYFPHNSDLSSDDKIQYIEALYGLTGYAVYIKLLEKIYHSGYFMSWEDRDMTIFSRKNGLETTLCQQIVVSCIKEKLFNGDIFEKYSILTSAGIQKRYLKSCERRKIIHFFEEYFCLSNQEVKEILGENKKVDVIINPINVNIYPQSKVKEIEKESKENTLSPSSGDGVSPDHRSSDETKTQRESEPTSPHEVETAPGNPGIPGQGIEAKGRQAELNPDIKVFIDFVFRSYQEKFGNPILISGGKDGKIIKNLLKSFPLERLKELWSKFLCSDDDFIEDAGRSIGIFNISINKLTSGKRSSASKTHCRHDEGRPIPSTTEQQEAKTVRRKRLWEYEQWQDKTTQESIAKLTPEEYSRRIEELRDRNNKIIRRMNPDVVEETLKEYLALEIKNSLPIFDEWQAY